MEKNIHNDGLEGFLRKSFEQYDDSPSDGLWDKIEADLADQPKVMPIKSRHHWWMAAALLLALVVAGQFFYFQNEKAELVEIINAQSDKINSLEKELKEQKKENEETSIAKNNSKEIVQNKINESIADNLNNRNKNTQTSISNNKNVKEEKHNIATLNTEQSTNENETVILDATTNTISFENKNQNIIEAKNQDLLQNKNNDLLITEEQTTSTLNTLDLIDLKNIEQPVPNLSLPTTTIIPVSKKGSFSIGAHHTYLSTKEKMARVIRRPTAGPARIFNNTKAMKGSTQLTGISAIYQTRKNWQFESGINYQRTDLSTSHQATLRFMDRRPNSTADQQVDFVYALNTSAGVVDIEVRANQTDPAQTIDEFANVIVEIEAKQKVDYVSIPLLVSKQIGYGKLSATVKSGVLLNFLTDNSFDLSGKIISSSLQLRKTNFSRRIGIGLKNTTTDFMAAAGLNYALNKKWSAHVSPTLLIPLGSRHNDPYIETSGFSMGFDFGLNFKF